MAAATAALGHADAATVRLAARLLAGASDLPATAKKPLAAAVAASGGRRGRNGEPPSTAPATADPLDAATATLQGAAVGGRSGQGSGRLAGRHRRRPAGRPAGPKPVRLDALRTLAALGHAAGQSAWRHWLADADAEVRTLAAAVLARRDP